MKKYISGIIKHPLFSSSLVMIVGSNLANFLNLLYHPVMGKMLGPSGYGELATIISLVGLLGIVPVSLSLVVIKYIAMAKNDEEISALINWFKTKALLVSLIFSLSIFVASPVILSFLHINKILYLILAVIAFFFSVQSLLNRAVLQGLLKFKEMIISLLFENGLKIFISALLVYLGFWVNGAIGGFMISAILGWYITNVYLQYRKKQGSVKVDQKQIMSFIVLVLIQSIAVTSLYSSDVILVKHFFSAHDAGIYAALSTLGKIIFFGAGPIGAVMFPLVSKKQATGGKYRRIFIYSFLATLMIAVFMLIIYQIFPVSIISLLYGTAYLEATGLLVWFGMFVTLFTVSSLLINFHLSLGRTKVVWLPAAVAISQIILIWFYHRDLFTVIMISITVAALLLGLLLIYSSYEKWRSKSKAHIGNSPCL